MFPILDYISRLVPSFKKHEVFEGIDSTRQTLRTIALAAYTLAEQNGQKFTSKEVQERVRLYERSLGSVHGNIIKDVLKRLENAEALLDSIEQRAKKVFSDSEANLGLSYEKATYLRVIGALNYASVYAIDWLNWALTLEQSQDKSQGVVLSEHITPAQIAALDANWDNWLRALEVCGMSERQLDKGLSELPDAVVTDLTEQTFAATLGMKKLDPFGLSQFTANYNLFYFIGMRWVEWRVRVYHANKAKLELLQLRLLNLRKLAEKEPDARLQKEIEYTANRVNKLDFALRREEQEYLS